MRSIGVAEIVRLVARDPDWMRDDVDGQGDPFGPTAGERYLRERAVAHETPTAILVRINRRFVQRHYAKGLQSLGVNVRDSPQRATS